MGHRRARDLPGRRGPRPVEHTFQGRRGALRARAGRREAALHRHRLPRHQLRSAATRRTRAARAPGDHRPAGRRMERVPRARHPSRASRLAHGRRPLRDPLHVGYDRSAQGCDADARRDGARVRRVVDGGRPATGRPLPRRQSVLPLVRPQRGHRRKPRQGGDDHPARGLRRRRGDAARRRGARVDAARAADRLPVDPRPSPTRRVRHVVAAARGDGRGCGAGRADPADARRAGFRDDRHRLRAHRGDGNRDDVPPRRRPRDDRHHVGPRDPRRRGARRRREHRRGAAGRAGRGRHPRLQRHARLHPRSRSDRRGDRRRRAGCTRAMSRS